MDGTAGAADGADQRIAIGNPLEGRGAANAAIIDDGIHGGSCILAQQECLSANAAPTAVVRNNKMPLAPELEQDINKNLINHINIDDL